MNLEELPVTPKYVTKMRVTSERAAPYPLYLEVTSYALNDQGLPYIDSETKEAATEVRRYRIQSMELE